MTISIGTSTPSSVRDTQTAWLRMRAEANRAHDEEPPAAAELPGRRDTFSRMMPPAIADALI